MPFEMQFHYVASIAEETDLSPAERSITVTDDRNSFVCGRLTKNNIHYYYSLLPYLAVSAACKYSIREIEKEIKPREPV